MKELYLLSPLGFQRANVVSRDVGDNSLTKHFLPSSVTTLDWRWWSCATPRGVTHLSQVLLHCGTRLKVHALRAPRPQPTPATSCLPCGRPSSLPTRYCVQRASSSATVSPQPTCGRRSWYLRNKYFELKKLVGLPPQLELLAASVAGNN